MRTTEGLVTTGGDTEELGERSSWSGIALVYPPRLFASSVCVCVGLVVGRRCVVGGSECSI